jgi:predicted ester cyclase
MVRTIRCSCGYILSSSDEEKLYAFVRAHAVRTHPAPHHPTILEGVDHTAPEREAQKALIQRWEEEVVSQGNLSSLDDLSPTGDGKAFKAQLRLLRTALPDLSVTIEEMVTDADAVAVRSTLRGTHQGDWMDIAPTGNEVAVEAVEFFRIEQDRIVEHWGHVEGISLLQQLGVLQEEVRT